jgi:hypothetical protein
MGTETGMDLFSSGCSDNTLPSLSNMERCTVSGSISVLKHYAAARACLHQRRYALFLAHVASYQLLSRFLYDHQQAFFFGKKQFGFDKPLCCRRFPVRIEAVKSFVAVQEKRVFYKDGTACP